jgi:hypothetical protein
VLPSTNLTISRAHLNRGCPCCTHTHTHTHTHNNHTHTTGTAARQSDLSIGDTIVGVDGESVEHLEPKAIVLKIAGIYKTEVGLGIWLCAVLHACAFPAWSLQAMPENFSQMMPGHTQVVVETRRGVKARIPRDVTADQLRNASPTKK